MAKHKGIFQRGSTYWIRYTDTNGRQVRESTQSDKVKAAQDLLKLRQADVVKGEQPDIIKIKNHTFKELAAEYLTYCQNQRNHTNKTYMIDNLILEFGNLPLKNFTTQLLEKYQTRMLTTNRPALKGTDTPREPIAQATVNRRLATIKAMFTKALDWNMVNEATCKQIHKVKLFKGRKATNVKRADTLMIQLQGGPQISMLLDIVKNTNLSIALDNLDNYKFEFSSVVNIDNKLNWVISFSPEVVKEEPLYFGKIYVEQDNYAISRAEFSLDLSDEEKAAGVFVQKKPSGLIFMPTSTGYLVTYKEQNGRFYLDYVRVDLKFRCDWKRRLFKNSYTLMSELAITDRRADNIVKFGSQEIFRSNMVFTDKVESFTDVDFWGENNIIEPDNSIENAIKKPMP